MLGALFRSARQSTSHWSLPTAPAPLRSLLHAQTFSLSTKIIEGGPVGSDNGSNGTEDGRKKGKGTGATSKKVDSSPEGTASQSEQNARIHLTMPPWWKKLKLLAQKEDYTNYVKTLEQHLKEDPQSQSTAMAVSRALELLPAPVALQIWTLVKQYGVPPTTFLCVSVVRLLVKLGMLRHVEQTLTDMLTAGMKPHWAPFFYWADAYAAAGDPAGVAVVAQMAHKHGIEVSDHYHTLLVKSLCISGRRADTLKLLGRLKASGVTPKEPTWRALIHCHGSAGHAHQAQRLFDDMRTSGIEPGVSTWTALIHSYAECHMTEAAEKAMSDMLSAGIAPNVQTYTSLLKAHAQDGDADAALRLLQEMRGRGLIPNAFIWTVVLGACAAAGNPAAVRAVLDQMREAGWTLSGREYATLVSAHRVAGDLTGCQAVLAEMEEKGIPRTLNVYTEVVMLLGEYGLPHAAIGAVTEMKERGIQPDWVFYNVFIATLMHNWVHLDSRDPDSLLLIQAQDSFREGLFSGVIKLPRGLNFAGDLVRVDLHNYGTWAAQLAVLELFAEMKVLAQQQGIYRAIQLVTGQGRKKRRAPMRSVVLRMLRQMLPARMSHVNEGTIVVPQAAMQAFLGELIATDQDPLKFSHVLVDPGDIVGTSEALWPSSKGFNSNKDNSSSSDSGSDMEENVFKVSRRRRRQKSY